MPNGDLLPALQPDHGDLYFAPAGAGGRVSGRQREVPVVGVANVLVVNKSMPEQLAYDITRAAVREAAGARDIHPEARNLALATAVKGSPAPFHPGAMRFYRERACGSRSDAPRRSVSLRIASADRLASARRDGAGGRASLYSLYWVLFIVQPQVYRVSFLLIALVLTFLLFPARHARIATGVRAARLGARGSAVVRSAWPLVDFARSSIAPPIRTTIDVVLGADRASCWCSRRRGAAVGWILPVTAAGFLAYAMSGPVFDRIGLRCSRIAATTRSAVGTLYMTLEGIFGVPLDVAATYIILFTIYGAVLEASGAGKFFIDWAMAAMGSRGPARRRAAR